MHRSLPVVIGVCILILLLLSLGSCQLWRSAQTKAAPEIDPRWARMDSLIGQGLYASAAGLSDSIKQEAITRQDWRTEFRAWMNTARLRQAVGDGMGDILGEMEQRLLQLSDTSRPPYTEKEIAGGVLRDEDHGHVPLRQLLHSALGQGYWEHYQQQRWRVLDRTPTDADSDPALLDTWDQGMYMRQIIRHFRASLAPADTLAWIPAAELGELLTDQAVIREPGQTPGMPFGRSGSMEEPMLLDLLVRRALAVLVNSETRLSAPNDRYRMDDPALFKLFEYFAHRPIQHPDTIARELNALRAMQALERAHLQDDEPEALTYATLERLAFIRTIGTMPNKDSLYVAALELLRQRVERVPAWSEATVHLARWHAERSERYQPLLGDEWKGERRRALELCEEAITRHPGSFGARNAEALKARLLEPRLSLRAERAIVPGAPFHALLGYANLQRVHLRVVKDPSGPMDDEFHDPERERKLLQANPIATLIVEPPDDGDLNMHHVEVPMAGLPLGRYVLLLSDGDRFRHGVDRLAYATFQVTGLACADRTQGVEADLVVLDRVTGAPRKEAKATAYIREHRSATERYTAIGNHTTDADGFVRAQLQGHQGMVRWTVTDGADTYTSGGRWIHPYQDGQTSDSIRTFLFTDRAIYRPGQTIHFKGIVSVARGGTTLVKSGHATSLRVFDVNGRVTDSMEVVTDAFGSFHGTTTAPPGLTGMIRIEEKHGSQWVRVEEYKRPTFEVHFDTTAVDARLGALVELRGSATTYSGSSLDGATVRWTVRRTARIPWWSGGFRGFPGLGRPEEIATGTSTTDARGRFALSFTAWPDANIATRHDPLYQFTVEAEVTGQGGETQAGTTAINVGQRSFEVDLMGLDAMDRSKVEGLPLAIRDLAGRPMDRTVTVRIEKLVTPRGTPRPRRIWDRPDRLLAGQVRDPRDHDPIDGDVEEVKLDLPEWHTDSGLVHLPGIRGWDVGSYRITMRVADAPGDTLEVRQHFTVYDPTVERSGFVHEAISIRPVKMRVQPGDEAELLVGTAAPYARILMEVERGGTIVATRWFTLRNEQQLVRLPVMESDRGGFAVHFIAVSAGRETNITHAVEVPWDDKELRVEWMSFRDRTLPGAQEEWRMRITGAQREKVSAQLLATLYDASLDHFVPHGFNMFQWPSYQVRKGWQRVEPVGARVGIAMQRADDLPRDTVRVWPEIDVRWSLSDNWYGYYIQGIRSGVAASGVQEMAGDRVAETAVNEESTGEALADILAVGSEVKQSADLLPPPLRSDFRETAFFFPDLLTDPSGDVVLRFTMPEALTRWRLLGLAHTSDLKLAHLEREVVTRKTLMVMPNLPRFLREGDRIILTARIDVLEGEALSGTARLHLIDPHTGKSVEGISGPVQDDKPFTAGPGASAVVHWEVVVLPGIDAMAVRIEARTDGHADGEERTLPVLSDRVLLTASLPMALRGPGTRMFKLPALLNSGTSSSVGHQSLQLEFTANPAWYAVQALPYLMEFPHACAEQIFGRFYANTLAAHVSRERPAIREVFEAWRHAAEAGGPDAFLSALEKNPELKGIVLEETPWVLQARDESERKRRIALLFDLQRMATEQGIALGKLRDMQLNEGSWPWFSGMGGSRWVTQHIVAGFGHLERLGAADLRPDGETQRMLQRAVRWLDVELEREHKERQNRLSADERARYRPGYGELFLLYARGFFPRWPGSANAQTAMRYLRERLAAEWTNYGLQEQAMIALVLHRADAYGTPKSILASLKERATVDEELGMYWKGFRPGYQWNEFPTETHALLIEAFHEVGVDAEAVEGLRQHLLTLKRTTDWGTTKATATAVHALLLTGPDLLAEKEAAVIEVGGERAGMEDAEAGTGYISKRWPAGSITPAMGTVRISTSDTGTVWGALHWQYFERMDQVEAHGGPFELKHALVLRERDESGTRLIPLDAARPLIPGDRVTVRMVLTTDRWLDHVHLKDLRAAGLEPVGTLSGAHWQGGLSYYQSIRDAAMHFFFDRLAPGEHVFEYDLRVTHAGDMSNGVATVQCMYAPEYGANSEGVRLKVLHSAP